MASKPSTVVISATSREPDDIIKLILEVDELPEPTFLDEQIRAYPWRVDTKYYTADIHVCALNKKTIGSKEFAAGVGAVVVDFDPLKEDGMQLVETWFPFIKELSPEVQILVCDTCPDLRTLPVQQWCVEHKFELVELEPEPCSDQEDEDLPGLAVTTGIRRIVQALHAHLWPNMTMKEKNHQVSPAMHALLNEGDAASALCEGLGNLSVDTSDQEDLTQQQMMTRIDELLGAVDMNCDPTAGPEAEFGALLARLGEVKAQVASMPSEERRVCAEQVVMAFWHAIGGDEEELQGLSDEEPHT